MHSGAEFILVEMFQCRDNPSHLANRTYPKIPATTVSGPTASNNLCPDKSFVSQNQFSFAWFGDDTGVGFVVSDEVLGADTRVLLIGYQRHQDLSSRRMPC